MVLVADKVKISFAPNENGGEYTLGSSGTEECSGAEVCSSLFVFHFVFEIQALQTYGRSLDFASRFPLYHHLKNSKSFGPHTLYCSFMR